MTKNNLVFLELNEINFDVVSRYLKAGEDLPGFKRIFATGVYTTTSETEYEHLEPWIQWPSVHTGLKYSEHNIFRLGDIVNTDKEQYFEKLEKAGFTVGAISPMNTANRLEDPAFFIPDPWTRTHSDGGILHRNISKALAQAVNDNSEGKLTRSTIFWLLVSFFLLVNPTRYWSLFTYALTAIGKSWRKALFLDMFLFEIHQTLCKTKKPNFSTLFLNAGAHIQHHYFYNSRCVNIDGLRNPEWYISNEVDPILEMLKIYDKMIISLLQSDDHELLIATGLSQIPYQYLKFYYRLKDHKSFLDRIGLQFESVSPRMTRDFLVTSNRLRMLLKLKFCYPLYL